jgi:hypothetical protein
LREEKMRYSEPGPEQQQKQQLQQGFHQRFNQALHPNTSPQESRATLQLLGNHQYLPKHMRNQFLQDPRVSAVSLVQRLHHLAEVSPEFRQRAKPLLDQLANFFQLPPEGQEPEELVANQALVPEAQPLQEPERKLLGPKPEESEQQVLSDLGAQLPLPGSAQSKSPRSPQPRKGGKGGQNPRAGGGATGIGAGPTGGETGAGAGITATGIGTEKLSPQRRLAVKELMRRGMSEEKATQKVQRIVTAVKGSGAWRDIVYQVTGDPTITWKSLPGRTIKGVMQHDGKLWRFEGKINGSPWKLANETKRGLLAGLNLTLQIELGLRQLDSPSHFDDPGEHSAS